MKNKLSALINPKSVALIGATERPGSVGAGLVANLKNGQSTRRLFWINPHADQIAGETTYPSILSVQDDIDLAIIAVPAEIVPGIVDQCCQKKVGAIIIISAGFSEIGEAGQIRQQKILASVRQAQVPLLGPNCLGLIRPSIQLNASFAPLMPQAGGIAFISQSGALMNSVVDRSGIENYGFSFMISYGNGADLSLTDFLKLMAEDDQTKVIAIYLEGLDNGREFIEVARKIVKHKPILILKSGRTNLGQEAVTSHTASLSGSYQVYQAAFRQSGIIEVDTLEELFDCAKALAWRKRVKEGMAIITNGGGMGVLATDAACELGLKLTPLSESTIRKLQQSSIMPKIFMPGNPLDIIGDADTARYGLAIEAVLSQKDVNTLIVIQTKQTMTDIQKNMEAIYKISGDYPDKNILSVCLPGHFSQKAIQWLEAKNIPNYSDPTRALKVTRSLIFS